MSTYLVCSSKSYQAIDDENIAKPYMVVSNKKIPLTTETSTQMTYTKKVSAYTGGIHQSNTFSTSFNLATSSNKNTITVNSTAYKKFVRVQGGMSYKTSGATYSITRSGETYSAHNAVGTTFNSTAGHPLSASSTLAVGSSSKLTMSLYTGGNYATTVTSNTYTKTLRNEFWILATSSSRMTKTSTSWVAAGTKSTLKLSLSGVSYAVATQSASSMISDDADIKVATTLNAEIPITITNSLYATNPNKTYKVINQNTFSSTGNKSVYKRGHGQTIEFKYYNQYGAQPYAVVTNYPPISYSTTEYS